MKSDTAALWRVPAALVLLLPLLQLQGQTVRCSWPGSIVKTIEKCPPYGCAVDGTPEAVANELRNLQPSTIRGPVLHLHNVEALEKLQKCVTLQQGLAVGNRKPFQKKFCPELKGVGEGMLVDIYGFIVGTPRIRRRDPASCLLIGEANNSFRINIAQRPDDPEYDSILVEMTPRNRNNGWTIEKLRAMTRFKVHVTGQLFYDNKHLVNADPDDAIPGEPKRMSLWEIHPVTDFEFCKYPDPTSCREEHRLDWTKLEKEEVP